MCWDYDILSLTTLFFTITKDIPKEKRAYVDEAGFDTFLFRMYARAPRGEKVHEDILGRKFQRSSIVAAKLGHEIVAPLQYQGTK